MSVDPKRLLDDDDSSGAERELLRSAGDVEPTPDARAAIWSALATRMPPGGEPGAPPPPAGGALSGGGLSLGAKLLGVALVGVAIAVAVSMASRSTPAGTALAPASMPAPSAAVTVASPSAEIPAVPAVEPPAVETAPSSRSDHVAVPVPPPGSTTRPRPAAPAGSVLSTMDALRDESALVATARAALRGGDGPGALAALETARLRHPRGVLLQEREVLAIEALAQTGNTDGASRRATAFVRAFPNSPHVAHVRTFVH